MNRLELIQWCLSLSMICNYIVCLMCVTFMFFFGCVTSSFKDFVVEVPFLNSILLVEHL